MNAVGRCDASGSGETSRREEALVRLDDVLRHCGAKPAASEEYPFGEATAVFKVAGKIFALCGLADEPPTVSLKCDPAWALQLRATYEQVRPGYHLNKRHWNTVTLDGGVDGDEIREMIDHSYELVVAGLPKGTRLPPDALSR